MLGEVGGGWKTEQCMREGWRRRGSERGSAEI